jgi:hypothetical protein
VALVVLSKVEQRLDAVRAVLAGAQVSEVALAAGVSRQSVHGWVVRYLLEGLPGWRTGHIGPTPVRMRRRMRCGFRWRSCAGSIRGGVRSGSEWSC